MAKKSSKIRLYKKPRPQPAQIKAVERLLQAGDYARAVSRAEALVRRFPDHGGLRRLLVEALDHADRPTAAAIAAFEWAERKPNSLLAQESLLYFAYQRQALMLSERVAAKVRELGGDTPGFPFDPELKETFRLLPDGTLADEDDMVRFDIGKLYLDDRDFAGTVRWLEGVEQTPARNNHAIALFHLGRIDEALAAFMEAWRADEGNLLALGWVLKLRFYQGDETGARGLATPLAAATARRQEDLQSQLDGLLLPRQDQAAWDAFERARRSDWFGEGPRDHTAALLRNSAACAACRLGKREDARRLWRKALEIVPELKVATNNLDLLGKDDYTAGFPEVFDSYQVLPITWMESLFSEDQARLATRLSELTATNAYLDALYIGGDDRLRMLVDVVLRYRVEQGDAEAAEHLKGFARLPIGDSEKRFGFLGFLRELNLLRGDEPVELWDGEMLRQVGVTGTEIHREPDDSGLPEDLDALLTEGILAFIDNRLEEAESKLRGILEHAPDNRVVLGNLAAIHMARGQGEAARELLRRVIAGNPDYLFARCNLATMLIDDGEIDEAEALLDGLSKRERLHVQEAFSLYGTLAMLHKAKGETEVAESLMASLEGMVEDAEDRRRMGHARYLLDRVEPLE